MPSLKSLFGALFGGSARLSDLEKLILDSVKVCLNTEDSIQWDRQVQAINKIQRLPEGVEINFYRMKNGHPTFDTELAFSNKTEELQIAKLEIRLADIRPKLVAKVWCVKGFLFSIEYEGSSNYFEEAAGLNESSKLHIDCQLTANLNQT